ncbi:MAG: hypothetical protein R3E45_14695 [Rhodocyclaceae bacterium]
MTNIRKRSLGQTGGRHRDAATKTRDERFFARLGSLAQVPPAHHHAIRGEADEAQEPKKTDPFHVRDLSPKLAKNQRLPTFLSGVSQEVV